MSLDLALRVLGMGLAVAWVLVMVGVVWSYLAFTRWEREQPPSYLRSYSRGARS